MSRNPIAIVVAVVIAALTAVAFTVATAEISDRERRDALTQVNRARRLLEQKAQLEGLSNFTKAEGLALDEGLVAALKSDSAGERGNKIEDAFKAFLGKSNGARPDILAVVDRSGDLVAISGVPSITDKKQYKNDKGEPVWPGLGLVLQKRYKLSEIWNFGGRTLMKVGVAPVIDPTVPSTGDDASGVLGAVIVAYAETAAEAQAQQQLLGTNVAYFDGDRVYATSFRNSNDEDTLKQGALTTTLTRDKLADVGTKVGKVNIDGTDYATATVRTPQFPSKPLPAGWAAPSSGALLLAPLSGGTDAGSTKLFILLLGIGALAISMIGIHMVHRRLIAQVDSIELGVADIINGNVERTFRPVGPELDGLANALNVMLAHLHDRPEPGEEELDEDGNPIAPSRVEFEDPGAPSGGFAADPELTALAQELEPDYSTRIYAEYVEARRASGTSDDITFEAFITKLTVNEGKLKAKHQCKAVRFRVVTKDGKVSLKPVPIF